MIGHLSGGTQARPATSSTDQIPPDESEAGIARWFPQPRRAASPVGLLGVSLSHILRSTPQAGCETF